jgi:hypothetical protein
MLTFGGKECEDRPSLMWTWPKIGFEMHEAQYTAGQPPAAGRADEAEVFPSSRLEALYNAKRH